MTRSTPSPAIKVGGGAATSRDYDHAKQPSVGKRTLVEQSGGPGPATASAGDERVNSGEVHGAPRATIESLFGGHRARPAVAAQAPAAVVQHRIDAHVARDAAGVHASAARGIATPASALPHGDAIQRSFGRHDVSSVKAHAGPEAEASTREMGAEAYATGDHVVFGNATDLFTVAHEAAHVVQQRAGVHLKGGVGEAGDAYERQADAVAGLVVRGESAEALLGEPSPAGGAAQVQRSPASGANDREREDDDGLAEAAPPVQQRVSIDTRSGTRIVIVNERARDCGRRGTVLRRSRTRRDCLVVEFDNERHAGYRVYLDEMDYERSSHRDDDAPSRADGAPSSRGQVVSGSGSAGLWRPTGQSSAAWQNCADFAFQDPFLGAEQMVARIAAQAHTAGLKVTRSHSEATVVLYGRGETYTHAIRKVGSKWQEVQYPGGPHREYQGSEDPPLSNGSDVIVLMLRPV